jgi:hypothetical protein
VCVLWDDLYVCMEGWEICVVGAYAYTYEELRVFVHVYMVMCLYIYVYTHWKL